MNIEQIEVSALIPYADNAKKHDETQIKNVMQSIKEFGIVQPLVCDKNGILIIGHCRLIACKRLKIKTVPVVRLESLTEDQVKKLRLLDNKLNESEWDFDLLADQVPELDFSEFEIDWDLPEVIGEEQAEILEDELPEDAPTVCQLGDVWQLGNHTLICGDSTDENVIKRLLNGEMADLLITDPPYNVDYQGGTKDALKIMNDKMDADAFRSFLEDAFAAADTVLKAGGAFYIWHADSEGLNFRMAAENTGWRVRQCLIWNKNALVMGRQDYQWKHEPCLYGWKEGAGHNWYSDRKQTTVIDYDRPTKSEEHPTMKPVGLFAYQIKNSTKENDIVLDIFGGSGTTIIACEQLKRKAYSVELDPRYCDVIIKRWENLTGEKAVKKDA